MFDKILNFIQKIFFSQNFIISCSSFSALSFISMCWYGCNHFCDCAYSAECTFQSFKSNSLLNVDFEFPF